MPSLESDYPRYLAAKRTVDDRAVNERVLRRLERELEGRDQIRVLNLGAGIGGGVERLVAREVFPAECEIFCTLVDVREDNASAARERLPAWARSAGFAVSERRGERDGRDGSAADGDAIDTRNDTDDGGAEYDPGIRIEDGDRTIDVEVRVADAFSVVERGEWDLLVGQAFLDLFDLDEALPKLLSALAPGGLCYFPITFDGGTIFEPAVEGLPPDDLQRAFHAHIERNGGDPRAGRHLLTRLPREGVEIVAAGSSDWVVHAHDDEAYPAEEEAFLRFIVDTIADALAEDAKDPDNASDEHPLTRAALAQWRRARHAQVDSGDLVYIAHQLDVLGRVPESDEPGPA